MRRPIRLFTPAGLAAIITVLGLVVLGVLTHRDRRQLARTALLIVPATVGGVLLVSAPDVLEQVALAGF